MKDFLKDNFLEIIGILVFFAFIFTINNFIKNDNKERIAIINNTKENVVKYSNCELIESYYYCYND